MRLRCGYWCFVCLQGAVGSGDGCSSVFSPLKDWTAVRLEFLLCLSRIAQSMNLRYSVSVCILCFYQFGALIASLGQESYSSYSDSVELYD